MHDYQSVSQGIEALESNGAGLFLALGIYRPHVPWVVPQEYFDRHPLETLLMPERQENDLDDLPERFSTIARFRQVRSGYHQMLEAKGYDREKVQAYLACVSFADDQVGRILDAWYASSCGERLCHPLERPWLSLERKRRLVENEALVRLRASKPYDRRSESRGRGILQQGRILVGSLSHLGRASGPCRAPSRARRQQFGSLAPESPGRLGQTRPHVERREGIRYDVVLSNDYRMTRLATGGNRALPSRQRPS